MSKIQEEADQTTYISDAILLIMLLLIINEIANNRLNNLKGRFPQLQFIQPTFITTLIGVAAGFVLKTQQSVVSQLETGFSQIFLILLLPPIMFESAIHMDTVTFFRHFGTINLYAVFGTIISMILTSLFVWLCMGLGLANAISVSACFAYGAIISATDPVAVLSAFKEMKSSKMLYTFIFGESILNDAVSLTLFQAVIQIQTKENTNLFSVAKEFLWVFFASIFIGYAVGIASAFGLRQKIESIQNYEVSLLILIPWVNYLVTEALSMSGIVSIVFCGISMSRYTVPLLKQHVLQQFKSFYEIITYINENSIFLFIGIGIVSFDLDWGLTGFGLILAVLIGILLSRFVQIFLISKLANFSRKTHKVNNSQIFMLWFSGLRGAMAYALSLQACSIFPLRQGRVMLTLTLVIIMINTLQGLMLSPILGKLSQELQENYAENEDALEEKNIFKRAKELVAKIDELFISVFLSEENGEMVKDEEEDPHYYEGRQVEISD